MLSVYNVQKERKEKSMSEVVNVAEIFGKNVFNETAMKERLPKSVFKKMKKTIEDGTELDPCHPQWYFSFS